MKERINKRMSISSHNNNDYGLKKSSVKSNKSLSQSQNLNTNNMKYDTIENIISNNVSHISNIRRLANTKRNESKDKFNKSIDFSQSNKITNKNIISNIVT